MTPIEILSLWSLELVIVAALASTPRGARVGLAFALAALAWPTLVAPPPVAMLLTCLALLWCAIRAADFVFEPPPAGFLQRLLHLVVVVDTRALVRSEPRLDRRALLRLIVSATATWAAIAAVIAAPATPLPLHYGVRWVGGAALTLVAFEVVVAILELAAAAAGRIAPTLHDSPQLARSVGEFWSRRWNRIMSEILRQRAFAPVARRGPMWGVLAAFALSAAVHAYLIGFAGGAGAALAWAAFFLVQPLAIAAERRLAVRRWPRWAQHAWTIGVLGLLSPLMVEPALRVLGL